jgi:hypothetical protein
VEIALNKRRKTEEEAKTSTNDSGSARNVLNGKLVTKRLFHFGKMNQWVYDGFATTYKI